MSKKLSLILEAAIEDAFDNSKGLKRKEQLRLAIIAKMDEIIQLQENIDDERALDAWAKELGL